MDDLSAVQPQAIKVIGTLKEALDDDAVAGRVGGEAHVVSPQRDLDWGARGQSQALRHRPQRGLDPARDGPAGQEIAAPMNSATKRVVAAWKICSGASS